MSEEAQQSGVESGGDAAIATAMALAGASRQESDAFLRDQRLHLHEQLKQLHLAMFEKWLGLLLRIATLCVGIAAATGLGMMVWDAAHSNGLLIEPFSVPPEMAARGLSGEVIAGQLLDHLTQMQSVTTSSRPAQSYASNWGNDVRVEIPETGVSVGEFQRFLKQWLGHDTRISGAVWRSASGIAISVRAAGIGGSPILGSEAEFDDLIQKAAEQVYGATQPYRYANYLDRNYYRPGAPLRIAEAEAIYKKLIYDPDPTERAWAWNGLGTLAYSQHGNQDEANRDYFKALSIQPNLIIAYSALSNDLRNPEQALWASRNYWRLTTRYAPVALLLGDYGEYARQSMLSAEGPLIRQVNTRDGFWDSAALGMALQHDGAATRARLRDMPPVETSQANGRRPAMRLEIAAALEDWQAVANSEASAEAAWIKYLPTWDRRVWIDMRLRPLLARAKAHLGDLTGAQALVTGTPGDCYICMRARAEIATLAKVWGRADYWYDRAIHRAPSIPFAYNDWGKSLLTRGKPDEAIAQFSIAHRKGPKFADPLEGWGEALMAQNQSHLALEKFAMAEKYAPNWGRLHLKWGEALVYAGKPAEAKAQFARAGQLDLTDTDRAELARQPLHG